MLAKLLLHYSFSRISHMQYRSRQPFQLHVVKSAKSEEHAFPAARRTDLALQIDLHKISNRDTRCYRLAASIRCCRSTQTIEAKALSTILLQNGFFEEDS